MAAVWGLDIGKSALKAVKLRSTKEGLEIQAIEHIAYPVDDDEDERQEHVSNALRTFLAQHKVSADRVVVGLPGLHAFSRFIKLPPVEQSKVRSLVHLEAQQQIPFPISEVNWDFVAIDREYEPGEEIEVGIFATRSELVDGFLTDLHENGVQPDIVTIAPLAVYNFVRYNNEFDDGATIILDIGSEHTDLVIIDGERFWIRNLRIAGNDITKALADRFKVPFAEAEKLKRSSAKSAQAKKIFGTMEPVLKDLVGEVHRSVGFFKSQADDLNIKRVVLMGDGSKLKNIGQFLKSNLKYKVSRVKQLEQDKFIIDPDVDLDVLKKHLLGFGVAFGLAVQGVNEARCAINLAPQQVQIQSQLRNKVPWAAGAAACSWIALLVSYFALSATAQELKATSGNTGQIRDWVTLQSEVQATEDVSQLEAQAKTLTSLGEGRVLTLQLMEAVRDVLPQENAEIIEWDLTQNAGVQGFKQIQRFEEESEAEGVHMDKVFLLRWSILHREDEEHPNRYKVELVVAKPMPRELLDNPNEIRDRIRREFVTPLEDRLADAPFYLRDANRDPVVYGEAEVGTATKISALHPRITSNVLGRPEFPCVMVTVTFEVGVPPEPEQPAPAAGGDAPDPDGAAPDDEEG